MSTTELNDYRQNLYHQIIEHATRSFARNGIKGTKMDMVARELSISKRTLYEIFDTKEALLYATLQHHNQLQIDYLNEVEEKSNNTMEMLISFFLRAMQNVEDVSPTFIEEIKSYPIVQKFKADISQRQYNKAMLFLQRGVAEGMFRDDINYDIILRFGAAHRDDMFITQIFEKYHPSEVFRNTFLVTMRGICTAKGLSILEEYEKKNLI